MLRARSNGQDVDLLAPLDRGRASSQIFTTKSPEALELIRHDAAHVVADAVQRLFPGTQVTIGPAIEDGFYYDFCRDKPFTPEDLEKIEAEANAGDRAADLPVRRARRSATDEAIALFEKQGREVQGRDHQGHRRQGRQDADALHATATGSTSASGPTARPPARSASSSCCPSSGAYWRGDHRNPMLQRIYGTAFFDKKALDAYLKQQEEAKKRDHRKLGKELDLFHFHPFAPGAAFWTPKGTALYQTLSDVHAQARRSSNGYVEIKTPLLFNKGLWEISGHWGKYKENMFLVLDSETGEHDFSLKPMNCPSHHLYYGFKKHSYRDLPLRLHTQDVLHRNEAAGSLGGLTRVRQFAQDDAHIYCTRGPDRRRGAALREAARSRLQRGRPRSTRRSSPPARRSGIGDDALWDRAEAALKSALDGARPALRAQAGRRRVLRPEDRLRRLRQHRPQVAARAPSSSTTSRRSASTSPTSARTTREHRPVVLHRAIYGSFERFIAILIEHFAGAFPVWLAPVQVAIVTVADRVNDYARKVHRAARGGRRPRRRSTTATATMQAKIRDAQLQKIPYTLVHRRQGSRRRPGQRPHLRRRQEEDGDDELRGVRGTRDARSPFPLRPRAVPRHHR